MLGSARKRSSCTLVACALFCGSAPAAAQAVDDGGFDLNQMRPAPAGDVFFGVPSPYAYGHLQPTGYVMFDYAARPIRLSSNDASVVSQQSYVRGDVSLALWERLLINVQAPVMVMLNGDDPGLAGTTFTTLEAPRFGDLRIGLRGRIFGEDGGPFQLGAGGYVYAPTGDELQYAGDGGVRGDVHATIGGRVGEGEVGFVYSLSAGPELRASDSPHVMRYGVGAALLLGGDLVQLGAELWGSSALSDNDLLLSSAPVTSAPSGTNLEVLGGVKIRVIEGLTFGAGAGPGLGSTVGTPTFRVLGLIGWSPLPAPKTLADIEPDDETEDQDDDGIPDELDACPDKAGEPSADPTKDGCPVSDRDGDGVQDTDDACPATPGVANVDITKNGCPLDSDDDGIHDGIDACPSVPGESSTDPKKNGCPGDADGDDIVDAKDACPNAVGDPHDDPEKNGCPPDPDGDGIFYSADACPRDKGEPNEDPKKNGCPEFVRVNGHEILINKRIEFDTYGDSVGEAVTPDSVGVLQEVAAAIKARPEIAVVEVQGHTDDSGDAEFNYELSERRAKAVRTWLIQSGGVSADRLVAKGYGFDKPIADNRVKTGRAKNRRVQFVIIKKK